MLVSLRGLCGAALAAVVAAGCQNPAPLPPPDFVDAVPLLTDEDPGERRRAHAHNDYEHDRPLLDALDQQFGSVEVDLFWRDGQLAVAHTPWEFRGELEPLYIAPLVTLVNARGSVYGDGRPFTLWIDLKDDSDALTESIHNLLAAYPDVFSQYDGDSEVRARPVDVIFTGAAAKERYVTANTRVARRDANAFSQSDPEANARWSFSALPHADIAPGAAAAQTQYRDVTAAAHARGYGVRIFGAPDDDANWCAQRNAGVDFIGTDRLEDLATVLSEAAARCETP